MSTTYAIRRKQVWIPVFYNIDRNQVSVPANGGGRLYYAPAGEAAVREAVDDRAAFYYYTLRALLAEYPDAMRWKEMDRRPGRGA